MIYKVFEIIVMIAIGSGAAFMVLRPVLAKPKLKAVKAQTACQTPCASCRLCDKGL